MENLPSLIGSLGFPIVAAIAVGFFCKYMIDMMMNILQKCIDDNKVAIDKLTVAVDKLCDKMERGEK